MDRSRSPQLNISFSLFLNFDEISIYYLELFEPHLRLFLHSSRAATSASIRFPEKARWCSLIGEVKR